MSEFPGAAGPVDSNGASDTIEVSKTQVSEGTGVAFTPDVTPADVTEGNATAHAGTEPGPTPDQEEPAEDAAPSTEPAPDPRTLDADGQPVPDFYAPPSTPPAHDPAVHEMAARAVQKVGTGVLVKFEHVVAGVASFAHTHPELDRVFVQGLLEALTAIEKS